MKLINKDALVAELKKRISDYWSDSENTTGIYPYALEEVIEYVDTLEVKEDIEHYELEEFAKIVRGNLTGINKTVQALFEAKYQQLTGNKMYRGYKD